MDPRFEYVAIDRLRFDPLNPRFPRSLDGTKTAAVLEFMLLDAGLSDLMSSIASQGFFPGEPLLVSPASRGNWVVVEGNRRLAASLLLSNPELAPTKKSTVRSLAALGAAPSTLPCLQFETRNEILEHLGYRHVTGIKEWEPLAKARFLMQRYDAASGSKATRLRAVSRTIGSRSDYVGRLLTALAVYNEIEAHNFFDIDGLSETSVEFSLISSVLAYSKIVDYLGLDSSQDFELSSLSVDKLRYLTSWVFERDDDRKTRLIESRNIRTLANIVGNERARVLLEEGAPLARAAALGRGPEEFRGFLATARENLALARNEVVHVEPEQQDLDLIEDIRTLAIRLRRALQDQLDEVE